MSPWGNGSLFPCRVPIIAIATPEKSVFVFGVWRALKYVCWLAETCTPHTRTPPWEPSHCATGIVGRSGQTLKKMRLKEVEEEVVRPVGWTIAHQVLHKLVKVAPVKICTCGNLRSADWSFFQCFPISYLFCKGSIQAKSPGCWSEGREYYRISSCKW